MTAAQQTVTITSGESLSTVVDLRHHVLAGIVLPSSWTAANITFAAAAGDQDGTDNGTFQAVYDADGNELEVTAAASRHVVLAPSATAGIGWLKLRSGTSGTPVNQGADRTLVLILTGD